MKVIKFLIPYLFCLVLFVSCISHIQAQIPTPASSGTSKTNGCGFPGAACCNYLQPGPVDLTKRAPAPGPFGVLYSFPGVSDVFNWIGTWAVNGISEVFFGDSTHDRCYATSPVTVGGVCTCEVAPADSYNKVTTLCNVFYDPVLDKQEIINCNECANKFHGFYTGIGCVPLSLPTFISSVILGPVIGLVGLIAFGMLIYSAFILQTSQGNPEKVKKAREILTGSIVGLIFIILSVFILRLIGVNILGLPGFSI